MGPNHSQGVTGLLKKIAWLYIAAIHLLLAVLLFRPDLIHDFKRKVFQDHSATLARTNPTSHERMDASVPEGAAIFLGDSITEGLAVAAVAPLAVNYGIGGLTTEELIRNIPKYRSLNRAGAIFLMIGINDIDRTETEGLADRLRLIANTIPQDRPLIWSGIMPVYADRIPADPIAPANKSISDICSQRKNCTFVDTQALFAPGDGSLFSDGVHPNEAGYGKWISALRAAHAKAIRDQAND